MSVGTGRRGRVLALAAVAAAAVAAAPALAAPRLITDNRIRHLTGRPSLGRGYSMQSNALLSLCFAKVAARDPTFDFEYEIDEVTGVTAAGLATSNAGRERGDVLTAFLRERLEEAEEEKRARGVTLRLLHAAVTIDSYDHALDEAESPLSESATRLLKDGRYASFFASCGFFYVRSLRTVSSYLAVLEFESTGDARADQEFIGLLESGLVAFGAEGVEQRPGLAALGAKAEERNLRIYVSALGLSKGEIVGLVPLSLDQFRSTVKAAAKLMQDADSGVVTGVEVAPWLDHPDVGVILAEQIGSAGDSFGRLLRLEFNSQVVTHVAEHRAFLLDQYYRARLCREQLDVEFARGGAGEGAALDAERTRFVNQAAPDDPGLAITLRQFREHFAASPPERLLEEADRFLHGREGAPGAQGCIDRLTEHGLDAVDAVTVPACGAALRRTPTPYRFLDDYCLPRPARVVRDGAKPHAKP